MLGGFSREDELLKKLQNCVGPIQTGRKNQHNDHHSNCSNQNINYKHGQMKRYSQSNLNQSTQRLALRDLSINTNANVRGSDRQLSNLKQNKKWNNSEIPERVRSNKMTSENYSTTKHYEKENDYSYCQEVPKYRKAKLQNKKQQLVNNCQNFQYSNDRHQKLKNQETYEPRNTHFEHSTFQENKIKETETRGKYEYKRANLNSNKKENIQYRKQNYGRFQQSPEKKYENRVQQRAKENVGKYQYQIGQKTSNYSTNIYKQRRPSLNHSFNEQVQPSISYNRNNPGVGSINSTASKRNNYQKNNYSFHGQFAVQDKSRVFQNRRNSFISEKNQFGKYSSSAILTPSSKSAHKDIFHKIGSSNQALSKQKDNNRFIRQNSVARNNNRDHKEIKAKKSEGLGLNDDGQNKPIISSLNIDTMEKLKRINQLNDKINTRIKNIIESFDTKEIK